jgi:beta-1,4-N-acetylglucosaminyltransferase
MTKIFVTIGTTPFDALMRDVDTYIAPSHAVKYQISEGNYRPKNGTYKAYYENLEEEIESADLIICHAGAGTVFPLLEANKRLLVVPNLLRRDHHQVELAGYLERNHFSEVAWDTKKIAEHISLAMHSFYTKYHKDDFNMAHNLSEMIKASCTSKEGNNS